ncbi:MAG: HAD-IC family P-type ATPase [Candidatus Micrarchaeota archaeon]
MVTEWDKLSTKEALSHLGSSEDGLSHIEIGLKKKKYGLNKLEEKHVTGLKLFSRQFKSVFVWILILASLLSFVAGEELNACVIAGIVLIVCLLGFFQEYKANKAVDALKKMLDPKVRVIRDGKTQQVPASSLVPGDIIILSTGYKIPADAKIIETGGLRVDESIVTGESVAVERTVGEILLTGTHVVYGRCKAVVFRTGMNTHLGEIVKLMDIPEEDVPLQVQTKNLTKKIAYLVLTISIFTLIVGISEGYPFVDTAILAVAVAVAGMPEALPLTVTIALAIGMKKMAFYNAIPKTMTAVETLGSVTVICTDKTGTLTKNQMTVNSLYVDGEGINISGDGYSVDGEFTYSGAVIDPLTRPTMKKLLLASVLCNNAELVEKEGKWHIIGTPTEGALLVAAAKADMWKSDTKDVHKRVLEIPFTSEEKYMITINKLDGKEIAFIKGAPERVLKHCDRIEEMGKIRRIEKPDLERIMEIDHDMASGALRILAVAHKPISGKADVSNVKDGFVFLGLVGMFDPPRKGVAESIAVCRDAGIKVVMITGDHPHTASAVAKRIGLGEDPKLITGDELDEMTDKELSKKLKSITVFARTHPHQKLRIVEGFKENGHIVAMTGDGVNDAPAIKSAHVGIAMGMAGSDVSSEAADIILRDDDFSTIVKAIEMGRGIYENLRKFTGFLLSGNAAEVSITLVAFILLPLLGFELVVPILALQILLINLIIDEMPAIALGLDPVRGDVMRRPPRRPGEPLLLSSDLFMVLFTGAYIATLTIAVFIMHLDCIDVARTMTVTTLVSFELFNVFNFRSMRESVVTGGLLWNKWMAIAIGGSVIVLMMVIYHPYLQITFHTAPLSVAQLALAFGIGITVIPVIELRKFIVSRVQGTQY